MRVDDAALAALEEATRSAKPLPDAVIERLDDAIADWQQESPPPGLLARPCSVPTPRWHLDKLRTIEGGPASHARRIYHARMLGHLLAPSHAGFLPRVTVLIPVYNRAGMIVEAVESCLAQDWRPFEILVVDDGSEDDPAATLRRFGDIVRVHRQVNRGVAAARNAGMALARGDFVHFLDSDNLLLPGAISRKLSAFRHVADADLCFSHALAERRGVRTPSRAKVADGRSMCATTNFLRATAARCPFLVSSVMIARWIALRAPKFEEDLRRAEDVRYWFSLALNGAKAVAYATPLMVRRRADQSLHRLRLTDRGPDIVVALRCAVDLLQTPRGWIILRIKLRAIPFGTPYPLEPESRPLLAAAIADFRKAVMGLTSGGPVDGLSPLPVLAILRQHLRTAVKLSDLQAGADPLTELASKLARKLAPALRTAPGLQPADLAYWRDQRGPCAAREMMIRFMVSIEEVSASPQAASRETTALLRLYAGIPKRRRVKRYLRLRSAVGPKAALLWLRFRRGIRLGVMQLRTAIGRRLGRSRTALHGRPAE